MLNLVFVTLSISLLVLLGLLVLAFLDVAFAGPPASRAARVPVWKWRPPLAAGDQLLTWASSVAQATAATRLFAPRTRNTAGQLAKEICEGATYAITQSPHSVAQRKPSCPSCRHQMIGVTAPEVLAIADEVRRTNAPRDEQRVRQRAAENAAAADGLDHEQYEEAHFVCPLLGQKNSCVAFDVRPLQCRGWCAFTDSEGEHCLLSEDGPGDAHAYTIGRGAADGLCRGLESAGLDSHVYELNSALATSLETPDAAEQWAAGKPVFADCKLYE